jgi:hypothetical protein
VEAINEFVHVENGHYTSYIAFRVQNGFTLPKTLYA